VFFAPLRDIPPLWGRNGARENRGSSRSAVSSPIYSEQDAGPTQVLRAGGGHAARSRSTRWSSRRFVSLGKAASRQRGDRLAGCRRRVKRRWAKAPNRSAPWVRAPVGEIARRGVARTQIARTQIAVAQNRRGLKARGSLMPLLRLDFRKTFFICFSFFIFCQTDCFFRFCSSLRHPFRPFFNQCFVVLNVFSKIIENGTCLLLTHKRWSKTDGQK